MADEVTSVDASNSLFAAMVFIAALAYPEDHAARDYFILATKAHCVRFAQHRRRMSRAAGSPTTNAIAAQQQRAAMRKGIERIRIRLQMAEIIAPSYLEALSKNTLLRVKIKIKDENGLELDSYTKALASLPVDQRTGMRHWAESKPVTHLAMALRSVILEQKKQMGTRWHVLTLLHQPGWILQTIPTAEHHLAQLRALPIFANTPFVRLIEEKQNS